MEFKKNILILIIISLIPFLCFSFQLKHDKWVEIEFVVRDISGNLLEGANLWWKFFDVGKDSDNYSWNILTNHETGEIVKSENTIPYNLDTHVYYGPQIHNTISNKKYNYNFWFKITKEGYKTKSVKRNIAFSGGIGDINLGRMTIMMEKDKNFNIEIKNTDIINVDVNITEKNKKDITIKEQNINISGNVTDIDGNVYKTIKIGNQVWMAANLRVTHYRNGDPIPNITSDKDWKNTWSGAYCVYDNKTYNAEKYGNLYNGIAVNDSRGLAPKGWHVPTDEDWKELEMYLGMTQEQAEDAGWRGTNEGSKLAGRAHLWYDGDLKNNHEFGTSGFNVIPGGSRNHRYPEKPSFYYGDMGYNGYFWSSKENDRYPDYYRFFKYNNSEVYRNNTSDIHGLSIRCVRD